MPSRARPTSTSSSPSAAQPPSTTSGSAEPAHLATRREQIRTAARRCFSRDGFHATSMQDAIAEAGLSVVFRALREVLTTLADRAQQAGHLPAGADPHAVGAVLAALLPGYVVHRTLTGEPEPAAFVAGLHALTGG